MINVEIDLQIKYYYLLIYLFMIKKIKMLFFKVIKNPNLWYPKKKEYQNNYLLFNLSYVKF